ncbi:hypothetical protein F5884DRAFT_750715 [Xylogone sp. PMI_703]|nr:hypothetical protein F5884DRAFT_750715 [Xylogone sp. PMI_703]
MWATPVVEQENILPQVKRFACDRCHDQKLRCTRPQEGESCVRCQRAGVSCNVSATQPTGRPRKSTGPLPEKKSSPSNSNAREAIVDASSSERDNKALSSVSERSAESARESSAPTPDTNSLHSSGRESWETFASGSSVCISPAPITSQAYVQPLSAEDYADLLACSPEQAYYNNSMDLSDMPECRPLPLDFVISLDSRTDLDTVASYLPTPGPKSKKRKTSTTGSIGLYDNPMSMSPPMLDHETSARITSFLEFDMPAINPVITASTEHGVAPDLVSMMNAQTPQNESTHSETLSKLQTEIDACSERIMFQARKMSTALNSYATKSQKLSEALGVLLSRAERFIELITCICRTFNSITPSRPSSPAPRYQQQPPNAMETPPNFSNGQMFLNVPSDNNRALSTGTFYSMLECHVRLLSAYDTTLDTMASRLLELESFDTASTLTSALSIGSFVVPFGAIIETILHLQVISHQLSRLESARRAIFLKLRPQHQVKTSKTIPQRLGLCHRGRSPSVSMVDFKLEEIQERERALKTKLLRIENLAESLKQVQSNRDGYPEDFDLLENWRLE